MNLNYLQKINKLRRVHQKRMRDVPNTLKEKIKFFLDLAWYNWMMQFEAQRESIFYQYTRCSYKTLPNFRNLSFCQKSVFLSANNLLFFFNKNLISIGLASTNELL